MGTVYQKSINHLFALVDQLSFSSLQIYIPALEMFFLKHGSSPGPLYGIS